MPIESNRHLHLISTYGCFTRHGMFTKGPGPVAKDIEKLFRYEVLTILKTEGKICDAVIGNMLGWRHSGFNVYCGPTTLHISYLNLFPIREGNKNPHYFFIDPKSHLY